jgi:hypothetical protein
MRESGEGASTVIVGKSPRGSVGLKKIAFR